MLSVNETSKRWAPLCSWARACAHLSLGPSLVIAKLTFASTVDVPSTLMPNHMYGNHPERYNGTYTWLTQP